MSALTKNTAIAVGFKRQAALQTASLAADLQRLGKLNANVTAYEPQMEGDAPEIGTGTEFDTNLYKSSANVSGSIEKYLSSEIAAWAFAMAFGNVTKTAAGSGSKYTCVPQSICDGLDVPAFTVLEQIGATCTPKIMDRAFPGCAINDLAIVIGSGPGRQSAKLTANFVGCGKIVKPSGIVMPASVLSEHLLPASSATITINSTNYVTNKNLLGLNLAFANNIMLDEGYYIGSGTDNGFAIRGRMEHGTRTVGLSFTARVDANSDELDKLMALTTGAATFTLTGPQIETGVNHKLAVTIAKLAYKAAVIGDSNGFVVVNVETTPLDNGSDPVISAEVTTTVDVA